ncbi:MAG TPA: hypothetical protein VHG08_01635 [Longimicrobium sp.]|nr:hypothetical protein [Longimicrobium sp.]
MSHITGTLQTLASPILIGPVTGPPPPPDPDVWPLDFDHDEAPTGSKFLILHFRNASFPGANRLEVDLGYGTDVFTAASGTDF